METSIPVPLGNRLKLMAYCAEVIRSTGTKGIGKQNLPPSLPNVYSFIYNALPVPGPTFVSESESFITYLHQIMPPARLFETLSAFFHS